MGRRRRAASTRKASTQIAFSAEAEIRRRIRERGRITFAEFAEVALYHPHGGYYTQAPRNDYFTSPQVHPAFGALLARFAHRVWARLEYPSRFDVIELGSGNGQLAQDFASYSKELCEDFQSALRYLAVDRSRLRTPEAGAGIDRLISTGVPLRNVNGLILSNELVDAFPVHRFEMNAGAVQEIFVTMHGEDIQESLGKPSTPLIEERLAKLDCQLPDGFRGEVNPGIRPMMIQIAGALGSGVVLTIDYGEYARDLYSPTRSGGTLRTFQSHLLGNRPLTGIGSQDITASVDFTALQEEGEQAGLRSLGMTTQADALSSLGIREVVRQPSWTALHPSARARNRMALEELARPHGLGAFKWFLQSKGLDVSCYGRLLEGPLECAACSTAPPLPLSVSDRVPLREGGHAGATFELDVLWPHSG